VKGLDKQTLGPRFEIEKTHRTQGHAAAGVKTEEQPLLRCLSIQLMLKDPKDIRRHMLKLRFPFIPDSTASHDLISLLPFDGVKHQSSLCGEGMMSSGGDLCPSQPSTIPGDDVAGVRNVKSCLVIATGDVSRGSDFKKFGVERPSIQDKG